MSYFSTYPFRCIVSHRDITRYISNRFFSLLFWFVFRHRLSQLLKKQVLEDFGKTVRTRNPCDVTFHNPSTAKTARAQCHLSSPELNEGSAQYQGIRSHTPSSGFWIPSTSNGKPIINSILPICIFMKYLRFPCSPTRFCMNFSRNLRRPMTFPAFRHHTTNSTQWSVQIVERSATSRQGGREFPLREVWSWLEISLLEGHPAILGFQLMTI